MDNIKQIGIDVLVVVAGVLLALKIKEQLDRAKVTPPKTT